MKYKYELFTEEEKDVLISELNDILRIHHVQLNSYLETISSDIGYLHGSCFVDLSKYESRACIAVIDVLFQTNQLYKRVELDWKDTLEEKPVWCKVWDYTDFNEVGLIKRYNTHNEAFPYAAVTSRTWKHATPLPDELQILLNKELSDE